MTKNSNQKELLRWNKKHFSSFLKQIKQSFLEGESSTLRKGYDQETSWYITDVARNPLRIF